MARASLRKDALRPGPAGSCLRQSLPGKLVLYASDTKESFLRGVMAVVVDFLCDSLAGNAICGKNAAQILNRSSLGENLLESVHLK